MVIKDEKGKPVILLTKEDIMEYVMEKCGFEIQVELESMMQEDKDEESSEYEYEIESLKDSLYDSEKENEYLRCKIEDLEKRCENYKKLIKKGGKNEGAGSKI